MDASTVGGARRYMCLAVIASKGVFHKAEAYLTMLAKLDLPNISLIISPWLKYSQLCFALCSKVLE